MKLEITDERRRELLDPELPEVCRMCELTDQNLRIPGQFLCETCAADNWGENVLQDVLEQMREEYDLSGEGDEEEP